MEYQTKHDGEAGGKGRQKVEAKRSAILAGAQALFLTHAYDRVSVDAIAATAGVSKVTVYSHFPGGKQDVFVAALSAGCGEVFERAFVAIEGGDLEGALAQLGLDFVSMITSPEVGALHQVMLAEGMRDPSLPRLFHDTLVRRSTLGLAARLEREALRGAIVCDNPNEAAEQFLALVQGDIVYRHNLGLGRTPTDQIKAFAASCAALFMRAMRP